LTSLKIGDKSWYSEHIGMQRYEPYRRDENTGRICGINSSNTGGSWRTWYQITHRPYRCQI